MNLITYVKSHKMERNCILLQLQKLPNTLGIKFLYTVLTVSYNSNADLSPLTFLSNRI